MPKKSVSNRLLASLSPEDFERISRALRQVDLKVRDSLHKPNEPIKHVYFVETGVVSLVSSGKGQDGVEVGTIGNEGMVGIPVFLGAETSPLEAFSQVPGSAWQLSVADFRRELQNGSALHAALHRYVQALFTQLSQSVACNRLHNVEQRCARWLLMSADRVGKSKFKLTQQFLAQMLGVRRATANAVLMKFQKQGTVLSRRGEIHILSRRRLHAKACECYDIIRKEYEKLTGKP